MNAVDTPALEPQLCMRRSSLGGLGQVVPPVGYSIRTSRDGDAAHWARIVRESFEEDGYTAAYFESRMKGDEAYRPDRVFFVCAPDGPPCATASAYRRDSFGPHTGYLHYVAVCPEHAGRKLGFAVSLAVLHKFRAEQLSCAVLQTDDFRLPAVKTYLRLGFVPSIVHDNQPARWAAVYVQLGIAPPPRYDRQPAAPG